MEPTIPAEPSRPDPSLGRRAFLGLAGAGIAASVAPRAGGAQDSAAGLLQDEAPVPPGVRAIDEETLAAAERIARLSFTGDERKQALRSVRGMGDTIERLRAAALRNDEAPSEVFRPLGRAAAAASPHRPSLRPRFRGPLPASDEDLAFAPLAALAHWIETKQVTSERLVRLSLDRLREQGPKLECVVTLVEERAMAQAKRADAEIAAGKHRGPLHGIPWGAKDLFDTAGIATTWGAEPWKDRVPDRDATVVQRLEAAGAVLVAKLSLGALAYGDQWFGGRTRNPWRTSQGSSGSSAGSAAATAAGLVGFALGTETYGSIGSPSARCGATGFRPSFGRVGRSGAMALCWSLDKIGPIARTAEDCALVLDAIWGADPGDPASETGPFAPALAAAGAGLKRLRVGVLSGEEPTEDDTKVLDALRALGVETAPVAIADGAYGDLIFFLISVEAAAAFDEMTRLDRDDELAWQAPQAWPNTFRAARYVPAVEYLQACRLRRRWQHDASAALDGFDAVIASGRNGSLHALTNLTGHPAITLRSGFRADGTPRGTTLWGRMDGDATLLRVGAALEEKLDLRSRRPALG